MTVLKAVLHVIVLVVLSLALLWVLFFLHGTGINSLLIPDFLRRENGAQSRYMPIWYALSCTISYLEWFGLLWVVNRFNGWYGRDWLKTSQIWIATVLTVGVAVYTAVCVAIFYVSLFKTR